MQMVILGMMGLGSTELVIIFFVLVLILLPYILFLSMLSKTLRLCSEHNRKMSPGEIWLVLIPLFGIIWYFLVVGRVADTLAAEFRQRNIQIEEERPGYNIGLAFCILGCCGWIPFLGGLASIAGLICWIVYWVKIAGYKSKLENAQFNFGHANPYPFPNPPQAPHPSPYQNQNPNQYQGPPNQQ